MLKSGTILKMGEGRDKSWSPKFFVLDHEKKRLSFYNSENKSFSALIGHLSIIEYFKFLKTQQTKDKHGNGGLRYGDGRLR